MEFIQTQFEIPLQDISPDDIFQGNQKLTLSLVFRLLLYTSSSFIDKKSKKPKELLLQWCIRMTSNYEVKIQNFSQSWSSGIVFAALLHHFFPNTFQFKDLVGLPPNDVLKFVFQLMNQLKIPILIEISDLLVQNPNENLIITQVSFLSQFLSNPKNIESTLNHFHQSEPKSEIQSSKSNQESSKESKSQFGDRKIFFEQPNSIQQSSTTSFQQLIISEKDTAVHGNVLNFTKEQKEQLRNFNFIIVIK